jgi:NAD(P)-dependent dehydrogenase (short-subunit alcohol dehydrogenase family)
MRWNDPGLERHYLGLWAYEQSKLANVLFSYELARRLDTGALRAGSGEEKPTVFAIDPGLVNTDMGQKHARGLTGLFWSLRRKGGASPARPASGIASLLSSPEAAGRTGLYWRDAAPLRSSRRSYDAAAASRLWELSEAMIEKALRGGQGGSDA